MQAERSLHRDLVARMEEILCLVSIELRLKNATNAQEGFVNENLAGGQVLVSSLLVRVAHWQIGEEQKKVSV